MEYFCTCYFNCVLYQVSIDHDDDYRGEKLCDIPEIVTEADESADGCNDNTDKLSVDTSSDPSKLKHEDSLESDCSSTNKAKSLERQESFECDLDIQVSKSLRGSQDENKPTLLNTAGYSNRILKTDSNVHDGDFPGSSRLTAASATDSLTSKLVSRDRSAYSFATLAPGNNMISDPGDELNGSLKSLDGFSGVLGGGKLGSKGGIGMKVCSAGGYLEPSGTVHYIQDDGTFNYEVISNLLTLNEPSLK